MNAEVLQLFRQAGGTVSITEHETGCEILTYTDNFDPAKFADLIVRECAIISNAHMIECESINYGIGTKIRQHFGVEE